MIRRLFIEKPYSNIRYGLTMAFILFGIAPAADQDLVRLSILDIETINRFIHEGYACYERCQTDSAMQYFDRLIAFDTTLANGYFQKARIYANLGQDSNAVCWLKKAVAHNMSLCSYADIIRRDEAFARTRESAWWHEITASLDAKLDHLASLSRSPNRQRGHYFLELVRMHCARNDVESAFEYLGQACRSGFNDPAALTYNPDCQDHIDELLDYMQQTMRSLYAWNGSVEQRIWGLMLIYAAVKYNCANLDLADFEDWDKQVLDYIPQVTAARSLRDYYLVLQKLVSTISDDHTYIECPAELSRDSDRPALSLIGIQGAFYVKRIFDRELEKKGIRPGMELVKIDNMTVDDYAAKNVYPYMPRKPDHSAAWDCARKLLVGRKGSTVNLMLKDIDGKTRTVRVARNAQNIVDIEYKSLVESETLPGEIVYINIRMFYGNAAELFEDCLAGLDLDLVRGMIIDLRDNPGGYTEIGDAMASHLIPAPMVNYDDTYSPVHIPLIKARHPQVSFNFPGQDKLIMPSDRDRYTGPLFILTSPLTCSAAENFIMPFKKNGRATIIGMPTSGGTGNSMIVHLPGQGYLRVCISTNPLFVGKGIQPDHVIYPTALDLSKNSDPILSRTIDLLRQEIITKNETP